MNQPRSSQGWQIQYLNGTAGHLHGREIPNDGNRHAWFMKPTAPALVLGSTQSEEMLNTDMLQQFGVELVRRRSGGGAVLLIPEITTWVDLIIPVGDSLWHHDVGHAMYPIGEIWRETLDELGVASVVHYGGLQPSEWSRQVCFAGIGVGEVLDGNRKKLVGISQRRTRAGARFQTVMYHADPTNELVKYLRLTEDEASSLRAVLGATTAYTHLSQPVLEAGLKRVLEHFSVR